MSLIVHFRARKGGRHAMVNLRYAATINTADFGLDGTSILATMPSKRDALQYTLTLASGLSPGVADFSVKLLAQAARDRKPCVDMEEIVSTAEQFERFAERGICPEEVPA